MNPIVVTNQKIEEILEPYRQEFPKEGDFIGYKNHCLRMLNVILELSDDEPNRIEKLEIALAFHDLTIFPTRTLDYLESSAKLAEAYLQEFGLDDWTEEIALMIENHHKITRYVGPHSNLVEAFRRSDWLDVSFGFLKSGLPRPWVRKLRATLPLYTVYPRTLVPLILRYMIRNPFHPLPNLK